MTNVVEAFIKKKKNFILKPPLQKKFWKSIYNFDRCQWPTLQRPLFLIKKLKKKKKKKKIVTQYPWCQVIIDDAIEEQPQGCHWGTVNLRQFSIRRQRAFVGHRKTNAHVGGSTTITGPPACGTTGNKVRNSSSTMLLVAQELWWRRISSATCEFCDHWSVTKRY